MKDKIIARLKAKFSGVNLSNARLDAIADKLSSKITDENTIDAKLDELNDVSPFSQLAQYDDWHRAKEAKEKADKEKAEKEKAEKEKQSAGQQQQPQSGNEAPEWAKALIEQNKTMATKLEQLESGRTHENNTARLIGILKEKKVPESYYNVAISGRTFKDATEAETYATQVADAYGKYNQEQVNNGLKDQPQPVMGVVTDPGKDVSPMMKEYIGDKKKQAEKQPA